MPLCYDSRVSGELRRARRAVPCDPDLLHHIIKFHQPISHSELYLPSHLCSSVSHNFLMHIYFCFNSLTSVFLSFLSVVSFLCFFRFLSFFLSLSSLSLSVSLPLSPVICIICFSIILLSIYISFSNPLFRSFSFSYSLLYLFPFHIFRSIYFPIIISLYPSSLSCIAPIS